MSVFNFTKDELRNMGRNDLAFMLELLAGFQDIESAKAVLHEAARRFRTVEPRTTTEAK